MWSREPPGVGQRVEREAVLGSTGNAEEAGRRAAGHDHRVEGQLVASPEEHLTAVPVDAGHRREAEGHVVGLPEDHPDRIGDVTGFEPGGRDLVEQGLEGVEVALVDDGDLDRCADEVAGRGQAREPGPHHDDAVHRAIVAQRAGRPLGAVPPPRSWHTPSVAWRRGPCGPAGVPPGW